MHELDPHARAGHRCALRVDGSTESLAQLMVALSIALSGTWTERRDRERGLHYILEGSPHDVRARVDLAPSALELDLIGFGDAIPLIAELEHRLRTHLSRGAN